MKLKFALGIFAVSVATLTYEVAMNYEFWYLFYFNNSIAVLSVAMFGVALFLCLLLIAGTAMYFAAFLSIRKVSQ